MTSTKKRKKIWSVDRSVTRHVTNLERENPILQSPKDGDRAV